MDMRKITKVIKNPKLIFLRLLLKLGKYMSDESYIKWKYFLCMYKFPNLDNPATFNEKLNWLKLHDIHPEYAEMVDKSTAKEYVRKIVGDKYIIPTLGVWDSFDEIDFDKLPNQFVLKTTHDSGGVVVVSDKSKFDKKKACEKLERSLKRNFFLVCREYPYKYVKRRIIAEQYLCDNTGPELRDYKFWCFNGKPVFMYCTNKGQHIFETFYDMNFNPVMINHGFPRIENGVRKPEEFVLMKSLAAELSKGIPFVRVDFYDVNHQVYFGEYTFFDWGGFRPFKDGWDEKLGDYITL